ncbi:hypothetical protein DZG00_04600 [Clavibacter lycopersici]|uniref:Uncharacterized protein n=1 Tax=Clavibacter lycopersici TaxID=2301718 RepID=A0A399TDV5_9MICO|nr:hypothetical protein [Clavibacter lycopersici]RIJ52517.1 hypothetical protein DZG00_04600 [Clavibacter lycopersici]RIJ62358.1 hypothetical protein DZG02_02200 [Clavibacter lycopersici]
MTDPTGTTPQTAAQDALLAIITDTVQMVRDSSGSLVLKTARIKSLATSYRLVVGGHQPGGLPDGEE